MCPHEKGDGPRVEGLLSASLRNRGPPMAQVMEWLEEGVARQLKTLLGA